MSTITVRIPNVLRHHTRGQRAVEANGATVGEVMENLFAAYPTLRAALIPASGDLFSSTNLFLNDEDATAIGGLAAKVKPGDSLTILPAMAGGISVQRAEPAAPV